MFITKELKPLSNGPLFIPTTTHSLPSPSSHLASLSRFFPSPCLSSFAPSPDYAVKLSSRTKCFSMSTEEDKWSESDAFVSDVDEGGDLEDDIDISVREDSPVATAASAQRISSSPSDYLSLAIPEQVYEVLEVKADGTVSTRKVNRRQLLKSSGLRPRDVRSVDPSLFLTNSMPTLLVREHAILLNLGSLRAIAMQDCVLIFDHNRPGGQAFIESLLPRLNPKNMNGVPAMPFELEKNVHPFLKNAAVKQSSR
ncbi:magnesium transporter MRS2-11, chloroplastic isoform X2 [Cucumis sativus]|uniref:magnesium transporter MRS2-11, chloroplastic isoform X2 n=1 Tax=Cucumis sativus TaxID=3659 RepID=UPI0012F4E6E9|nr:magnesium transporter MRS2-11, chloroplastic isoform X2 [Cucumis sativus]